MISVPAHAQTSQPTTTPTSSSPTSQIQQLQNGLTSAIGGVTGQLSQLQSQLSGTLGNITNQLPQIQSQLTGALSGLQGQLGSLGSMGDITSQISEMKGAIVGMIYPHGDPPWFIVYEPYQILCAECCRAPQLVFQHQISGSDPLGERDLQKQITEDFIPLIVAKFQEVAARISALELGHSALSNNVREGQTNIRSIQSFQSQAADALLNAQTSEQVCRIASVAQSLGASDLYSRSIQMNMMDYARDRQLLRDQMSAGYNASRSETRTEGVGDMGAPADLAGRWAQYRSIFCDPANRALKDAGVCTNTVAERADRDVDFTQTAGNNRQLDIKIAPDAAQMTKDSENIMALGNNLYASHLARGESVGGASGASERMMKQRSLYALRNVVANSYAAFVGARASGTAAAANSIKALITELGGDPQIIGERPSYETQMDALTRKLYQSPEFYKNIMENDTNVRRQQVALQAVELMNKRDIYESLERSEMLMAIWLELKLRTKQDAIVNQGAGRQ